MNWATRYPLLRASSFLVLQVPQEWEREEQWTRRERETTITPYKGVCVRAAKAESLIKNEFSFVLRMRGNVEEDVVLSCPVVFFLLT